MSETIVQYLQRVRNRDAEKHGPEAAGVRSTREIATYFDLPIATARRRLNALYDAGEIEGYDGGRETLWASKEPSDDR